MQQTFQALDFVKYLPAGLALLLWLFHWHTRHTLSGYEKMKESKQWHDLPELTPAHTQEATLDCMIDAKSELLSFSFLLSVAMSLIAAVSVLLLR